MHLPRPTQSSVLALVIALLALAAPAGAQVTEAQAIKLVKDATKAQATAVKASGKAALVTLDAALDALEASFSGASTAAVVVPGVGDACVAFLDTMDDALDSAIVAVDVATKDALESLGNGASLDGQFPTSLYFGAGGALDASRTTLVKTASKVRDAARKRLVQTTKKAETLAGIGLTVNLQLPAALKVESVNQNTKVGLSRGAELDLLVGGSRLDTLSDGVLVVAGLTDSASSDVDVTAVLGVGIADSDSFDVPTNTSRFTVVLDDGGAGLDEGNFAIGTTQTGSLVGSVAEIGLR